MRLPALALATALCLVGTSARAQEVDDTARSAARTLAHDGGILYQDGNYEAALEKLDKAYAVIRVPTLGYWSARCLEHLGRWVEASERYLEVTHLPLPTVSTEHHERAQHDAAEARRALAPRIPQLVIVAQRDVEVRIDGKLLAPALFGTPVPNDPGKRTIELRQGERRTERTVELEEGKTERMELRIEASNPKPSPRAKPTEQKPKKTVEGDTTTSTPWRTVGWVALGVGIVGTATGAATGIALLVTRSSLDESCMDDACVPSAADDVDTFNALRPATTVSLVIGAAGLAGGLALLLTAPDHRSAVTPWLGPGIAGVRIAF